MGGMVMFVRAELKRRAKEVLSRKYLKLFAAALVLYWLTDGIPNFKIFSVNFNFGVPTSQWLDAMTITLLGKTVVGAEIVWSAGFDVYAAECGCRGFTAAGRFQSAGIWRHELL